MKYHKMIYKNQLNVQNKGKEYVLWDVSAILTSLSSESVVFFSLGRFR